jgi:hypothetical protein
MAVRSASLKYHSLGYVVHREMVNAVAAAYYSGGSGPKHERELRSPSTDSVGTTGGGEPVDVGVDDGSRVETACTK